jgi:hypothetical protein
MNVFVSSHGVMATDSRNASRERFASTMDALILCAPRDILLTKEESSMATQNALFPGLESKSLRLAPEGFRYEEDVISETEEATLVASLATLELKPSSV